MLSLLLPNDDLREQVYDYIPLLLAEYQGGLEALFITQVRGLGWGLGVFRAPECPVGCRPGGRWSHGTWHLSDFRETDAAVPRMLVTQSRLTLCNPVDCIPPGFSVHGTSQARILEWVAISYSRGSS